MSESKDSLKKYYPLFLLVLAAVIVIPLIVRNISAFGNILLIVIGFGAVVLVHEFGHFIFAKLAGIKVEAFSIGFPPVLAGIRKTGKGFRVRILPDFFGKTDDGSGDEQRSSAMGAPSRGGETEYRIGLIPFGGFVKMLGQDDIGPDKAGDDPRSFSNKPVGTRMAVITAGVVFNVISAIIVFVLVFLVGVKLIPAVVGGVVPGSPAQRAGIKAGDEIIEIAGKSGNLDFSDIIIAAALSDVNEAVQLKVRHADGLVEQMGVAAEYLAGADTRIFGIGPPQTLTIAEVSEPNTLYQKTGLRTGDLIVSVNGIEVENYWQLEEIIGDAFVPAVKITARRQELTQAVQLIESEIKLILTAAAGDANDPNFGNIYGLVPRLKVAEVPGRDSAVDPQRFLESGDVIISIADTVDPTFRQLRSTVDLYRDRQLAVKVLRKSPTGIEQTWTIDVLPKWSRKAEKVMIGIGLGLDFEHAVIADAVSTDSVTLGGAVPGGSVITAVNGVAVSNFFDIAREIGANTGKAIVVDYRLGLASDDVILNVEPGGDFTTVKTTFADFVPFEEFRRLYKAAGPIDAITMGYNKTITFIGQTYVTLKGLLVGGISPKQLIGPVGIITLSYKIVSQQPIIYYVYFLGLISACIAVFNFLPLPPLDGGLIVLLLAEKIKGSAISQTSQAIIAYTGWVLIGAFFLYITFNDIVRSFFS